MPKNKLIGISNEKYWIIFKLSNWRRNTDGIPPSLTSSINLNPVFAKSMSKRINKTDNTECREFL
jgi:hypothetical protein|tara:strand:- start:758 stop:952 length:195 start_codon:yes stop_codon:yes gene_type:complete